VISIIVPVYNEERTLSKAFADLQRLSGEAELIFVDGGSIDGSPELCEKLGKLYRSEKGRAQQMNKGACLAEGDILLFLHADSIISPEALSSIEGSVKSGALTGGCLTQRLDSDALIYRFIENFGNIRARFTAIFYGDQGIFVTKEAFSLLGGFPETPIMEDVIFSKRLRKSGRTRVLEDKIIVSSRRWQAEGVLKACARYTLVNILYRLGVPLQKIKNLCNDLR